MVGPLNIIETTWRQQNMYEIRKSGKTFRVYDKERKRYVCNTKSEDTARLYVTNYLLNRGFEGEIPDFFLRDSKFGVAIESRPPWEM